MDYLKWYNAGAKDWKPWSWDTILHKHYLGYGSGWGYGYGYKGDGYCYGYGQSYD